MSIINSMLQTELKSYLTLKSPLISRYWSPYVIYLSTLMHVRSGTTTFFFVSLKGRQIAKKKIHQWTSKVRQGKLSIQDVFIEFNTQRMFLSSFYPSTPEEYENRRDNVSRELIPSVSVSVSCLNIIYQTKINPYRFSSSHKVFHLIVQKKIH